MSEIWEAIAPDEFHVHRAASVYVDTVIGGRAVSVLQTGNGRALVIDGRLQSTEADEWIYHEALVQPAMACHADPRRVLCVSGSTGGILRELLRSSCVREAMFVNADPGLVALTREHLPHLDGGVFDDRRVRIAQEDVAIHLGRSDATYDVIVADPPEFPPDVTMRDRFLNASLLGLLRERLGGRGVLALAAGAANVRADPVFPSSLGLLESVFAYVVPYVATAPSLGTPWGFVLASESKEIASVTAETIARRLDERAVVALRFYDPAVDAAMRAIPRYLREWLSEGTALFTEVTK